MFRIRRSPAVLVVGRDDDLRVPEAAQDELELLQSVPAKWETLQLRAHQYAIAPLLVLQVGNGVLLEEVRPPL